MKSVHRDVGGAINSQYLPPLKVPSIHMPHQNAGNALSPRLTRAPILAQFKPGVKPPINRPSQVIMSPRANPRFKQQRNQQIKQYSPQLAPLDSNYNTLEIVSKDRHETINQPHTEDHEPKIQLNHQSFDLWASNPRFEEEEEHVEQCRDRLSSRRESRRERKPPSSEDSDTNDQSQPDE